MARPHVLDDAKRREICALLSAGVSLDAAAHYVGCSLTTIRRELARDDAFRQKLRTAEAEAQLDPLRAMRKAARIHWRAAAWMLERTDPQRFGRFAPGTCRIADVHRALDAVIEEAAFEIADPDLRDRVCRRLQAAAYKATRTLATPAPRTAARTAPRKRAAEAPAAPPDNLDSLLAELESQRLAALAAVVRRSQNPSDQEQSCSVGSPGFLDSLLGPASQPPRVKA